MTWTQVKVSAMRCNFSYPDVGLSGNLKELDFGGGRCPLPAGKRCPRRPRPVWRSRASLARLEQHHFPLLVLLLPLLATPDAPSPLPKLLFRALILVLVRRWLRIDLCFPFPLRPSSCILPPPILAPPGHPLLLALSYQSEKTRIVTNHIRLHTSALLPHPSSGHRDGYVSIRTLPLTSPGKTASSVTAVATSFILISASANRAYGRCSRQASILTRAKSLPHTVQLVHKPRVQTSVRTTLTLPEATNPFLRPVSPSLDSGNLLILDPSLQLVRSPYIPSPSRLRRPI